MFPYSPIQLDSLRANANLNQLQKGAFTFDSEFVIPVKSFSSEKPVEENWRATVRGLEEKEKFQSPQDLGEVVYDDHRKEKGVDTVNSKFFKPANVNGQKGMVSSPGADALVCENRVAMLEGAASPDKNLNQGHNVNVYMEQERLVLTNFRDFLKKIISCGKHGR